MYDLTLYVSQKIKILESEIITAKLMYANRMKAYRKEKKYYQKQFADLQILKKILEENNDTQNIKPIEYFEIGFFSLEKMNIPLYGLLRSSLQEDFLQGA